MRGRHFGQPQRLKLRKHEEKQIVRLLTRLPAREPPVEIRPYAGAPFAVDYAERFDCFVPLRVGAEGFHADYDARTGARSGASFQRVPRLTRIRGVRHVQWDEVGGGDLGGRFQIMWYADHHYGPLEPWRMLDSLDAVGVLPFRIVPDDGVRWLDPQTAKGPKEGEPLFAGFHSVGIGGCGFECLRAMGVWRDVVWPWSAKAPSGRLDDRYLTRVGRTVLLRRYRTEADYRHDYAWDADSEPGAAPWEAWSQGRARLVYNGIEYRHWFDVLTDASFGLTWERIGW